MFSKALGVTGFVGSHAWEQQVSPARFSISKKSSQLMTSLLPAAQTLRSDYTSVEHGDMQLRTVSNKYHQVKENGNRFPVPADDLRAALFSAGIDLRLIEGEVLSADQRRH